MISKTNPLYVKADLLAKEVYKKCRLFPKQEMYGLTSQLRRAVLSIILNIVEGFARQGEKEFRRFLVIAFGSLEETRYLLEFSLEQNYLNVEDHNYLIKILDEVAKIIWSILYSKQKDQ
ncbi:MAG TPA: four helix bundle protein [Candidatus Magasanikbacteria bacterium]|nr:four helix bundle protein [Candidatus Magasanikbacteria bacterium]